MMNALLPLNQDAFAWGVRAFTEATAAAGA